MYIRTYDQYPSSSPQLTLNKKCDNENLAKSTREGQHLKNIILRTSLSKYPKSPAKHTQQNQQVRIESHFYESGNAGTYLKNNRIREVKTKYRAKQRTKQKIKQQLMGLLERGQTNRVYGFATTLNQSPERRHSHNLHFSIAGVQVSPEDKFNITKACSADKIHTKQLKSQAVLDLTKLTKLSNHRAKSNFPKYTDCISEIYNSSRKWKETEQAESLKIDFRRSMTSHKRRTNFAEDKHKHINSQRSPHVEKGTKIVQNINPWAVKKLQEDQQLMF